MQEVLGWTGKSQAIQKGPFCVSEEETIQLYDPSTLIAANPSASLHQKYGIAYLSMSTKWVLKVSKVDSGAFLQVIIDQYYSVYLSFTYVFSSFVICIQSCDTSFCKILQKALHQIFTEFKFRRLPYTQNKKIIIAKRYSRYTSVEHQRTC